MSNISKVEKQTIEDFVFHDLEFQYIFDTGRYYQYLITSDIIDEVLDDYIRIVKHHAPYTSKVSALEAFTIRVKKFDKDNYTSYEDLT